LRRHAREELAGGLRNVKIEIGKYQGQSKSNVVREFRIAE
jgi:hypothetical protein